MTMGLQLLPIAVGDKLESLYSKDVSDYFTVSNITICNMLQTVNLFLAPPDRFVAV